MERHQVIRIASHVGVAVATGWLLKQLGLKQGTVVAALLAAGMHEVFDAPLANAIEGTI